MQTALQEAYESGQLRGGQLMQTRRVLQRRNTLGKTLKHRPARKGAAVTTTSLVRNYQNEVERQKLTIKKAEFTQQRLLFVVEALRRLLADEHFQSAACRRAGHLAQTTGRAYLGWRSRGMSQPPGLYPRTDHAGLGSDSAVAQTAGGFANLAQVQADHGVDGGCWVDRTLSVGKADKSTGQHILLDGHPAVGLAAARLHRRAVPDRYR